jgi:hypothetical protein
MNSGKKDNEKIEALQREIALLKSQWPAHSVPAAMLERLDELEEALEQELQKETNDKCSGDQSVVIVEGN